MTNKLQYSQDGGCDEVVDDSNRDYNEKKKGKDVEEVESKLEQKRR